MRRVNAGVTHQGEVWPGGEVREGKLRMQRTAESDW